MAFPIAPVAPVIIAVFLSGLDVFIIL
jgi:hypothetical protein